TNLQVPTTPHVPKTAKAPTISKPPSTGPRTPPGNCPLNALKLGACVDLLGGLVHVGLGDPVINQCCPRLQGVLALEVALCTTFRVKLLNLKNFLPLALELIASCGLTPPPGFKCPS
ncbi:hypothetical protein KI387_025976, partial [Taxus chinensis]